MIERPCPNLRQKSDSLSAAVHGATGGSTSVAAAISVPTGRDFPQPADDSAIRNPINNSSRRAIFSLPLLVIAHDELLDHISASL